MLQASEESVEAAEYIAPDMFGICEIFSILQNHSLFFFKDFQVQGQWLLSHGCMPHTVICSAVQEPWKTPNSTIVSDPFTLVGGTPEVTPLL